jgi:predicted Zn-dependent protease with MMP-like domain
MPTKFTVAPSLDDLAEIAEAALQEIPAAFRDHVEGVALRVDEFPDDETLDALEIESPYDLLGLYRGVDIGHKDASAVSSDVDMIFLYRAPILDEWIDSGEALADIVRQVLVHEIGHHLGLSDEDMHKIEDDAEGAEV